MTKDTESVNQNPARVHGTFLELEDRYTRTDTIDFNELSFLENLYDNNALALLGSATITFESTIRCKRFCLFLSFLGFILVR